MAIAKVQNHNGSPAIFIDGKPYPPMAMTTMSRDHRYLKELGDAGVKIYFVICDTDWLKPDGLELFKRDAEALLEAVPDAYMFLRLGLHPPMSWFNEHKDQLMTYSNGTNKPAYLHTESYNAALPGAYSLCSQIWREDASVALVDMIKKVEALPYADRIIGYFLAAGGTSEWYYINPLTDMDNRIYGDFSAAFRKEFGELLREKYGTEENMQRIWNIPNATFEHPIIPNFEERAFSYIDNLVPVEYFTSDRSAKTVPTDANLGVFLNADKYPHVADFYQAVHNATANSIIYFADVAHKNTTDKLIGAFYGSYGSTDFQNMGTAGGTLRILNSGKVDFLAAPGLYNDRRPGGYTGLREMQDSFRLRGSMYIVEEDTITHLDDPNWRDRESIYTAEDAVHIMKRDFSRNVCEDLFAWWFDQFRKGGRYDHPAVLDTIKRSNEIAQYAYTLDRTKHNDVALIFDQESIHYISSNTSCEMLDYWRCSDLGRLGTGVDYYFHNDLSRDNMPDYKTYIFMNLYYLTDKERAELEAKVLKPGQTAVWLYAQGILNPDRSPRMDPKYISELTHINVALSDERMAPRFRVTGDHPILKYADRERLYGYIDRTMFNTLWSSTPSNPAVTPFATFNWPYLTIDDDDATALGRFVLDGKTAFAVKDVGGAHSVLCASKTLRSELLRGIIEYSGGHLYSTDDDVVYANENFVAIHASYSGRHTLRFKKACSPFEMYEKKYYGKNVTELTLDLKLGETLMFSLYGEC